MGGVDGSSGGVTVFSVLPNTARRVDSGLESHGGDQSGDYEKNVSGITGRVFVLVVLKALEPPPRPWLFVWWVRHLFYFFF
ncbi:hypothetical protein TorRG33x02_045210 [Trema orientale]|uniref:Uncharacterized protein n=1 Tax=Trema orientale TaxID=63057 RepID=A0A2P5FPR0_TREOI|nr:hypothetical protein TorRG33x02_045210 [Trema orientale]